jgi:hypothetical protein
MSRAARTTRRHRSSVDASLARIVPTQAAAAPTEWWIEGGRTKESFGSIGRTGPPSGDAPDAFEEEARSDDGGVGDARFAGPGYYPSPAGPAIVAVAALAVIIVASQTSDVPLLPRLLVPVVGLFGTIAAARWLQPRHPDEPWLTWMLTLGVVVKIVASALRYRSLVDSYGAVGDASVYDTWGKRLANAWLGKAGAVAPHLDNLKKSNFLRWFTGVTYYLFGRDLIAGFFVFGLLAFVGSYLWYRAAVISLPFLDRKLYLFLLMFAPSIAFWPSSVGKEALMQFGLGGIALGTAHIMNGRPIRGVIVAFPAAWLVFTVRAHLLGLAAIAAAAAYLFARKPKTAVNDERTSLARPIGLILVAVVAVFAVTQGANAIGLQSLSLSSVQSQLEATNLSTSQGKSKFSSDVSLSPLRLPQDAVTVLLRPFPWEVESANQILASLEGIALVGFMVYRRRSLALSLRKLREQPFIFYCWTLTMLYVLLFQAFGNFGLLVRERSIVLPALYVLLCLDARRAAQTEPQGPATSAALDGAVPSYFTPNGYC